MPSKRECIGSVALWTSVVLALSFLTIIVTVSFNPLDSESGKGSSRYVKLNEALGQSRPYNFNGSDFRTRTAHGNSFPHCNGATGNTIYHPGRARTCRNEMTCLDPPFCTQRQGGMVTLFFCEGSLTNNSVPSGPCHGFDTDGVIPHCYNATTVYNLTDPSAVRVVTLEEGASCTLWKRDDCTESSSLTDWSRKYLEITEAVNTLPDSFHMASFQCYKSA